MEDLTGKQFGPYQIVAPLGEGGMAAVYKAYQPAMERYVALKVLPRQMANSQEFIARFKREARLLAQLQHPHILSVFDNGESDGYTYIVMPFISTGTLSDLMKMRRLEMPEIFRIAGQIGDALAYAHARGMVHRDIKPSNVLIDERGNCLLTDFGLARMVEATSKLTSSGAIMGTPAYMSPEQGTGVSNIDGRSDIYSLGVILYEMVTGQIPYSAETPIAIVFKHIQDPLPPPRKFVPDLSETLELILLKSLAKGPEDRYQTADDFVRAIHAEAASYAAKMISAPNNQPLPAPSTLQSQPPVIPKSAQNAFSPPSQAPARPSYQAPAPSGVSQQPRPPASLRPSVPAPSYPSHPSYAPRPAQPPPARKPNLATWGILGVGVVVLGIIALVILGVLANYYIETNMPATPPATNTSQSPVIVVATQEEAPQATQSNPVIVATQAATAEKPVAATATVSIPPSPTIPSGVPFVRINKITINSQKQYVVDYETFEYVEKLPGMHVHFFFNTVSEQNAGSPGNGPWKLYGGPRPFTGYRPSDRPQDATQLCALVANANHSILPQSGNCYLLPDAVSITGLLATDCTDKPNGQTVAVLKPNQIVFVSGISADKKWLLVGNPEDVEKTACWVPYYIVQVNSDTSIVPVVGP